MQDTEVDKLFELTFSKENAELSAKEILASLEEEDSENKMLDFEFDLKKGVFSSKSENTWYKFDPKENSVLKNAIDLISDERIDPTQYRQQLFLDFLDNTAKYLEVKYLTEFKDRIRKSVLGDVSADLFPIPNIKIINLEITELPPIDYVLLVDKLRKVDSDVDVSGISIEIFDEVTKTGLSPQEILDKKKKENNPRYANITSIRTKKAFYMCNLDLYVDYSINQSLKSLNNDVENMLLN